MPPLLLTILLMGTKSRKSFQFNPPSRQSQYNHDQKQATSSVGGREEVTDVAAGDNNVQVDIDFAVDAQLDDDHHAAGDVVMISNATLIIIGITVPIINGVVNTHYKSIS